MKKNENTTDTPTPTLADLTRRLDHWRSKSREYQGMIDDARATVKAILHGQGPLLVRVDHGDPLARAELDQANVALREAERTLEDTVSMAQVAADEVRRLEVAHAHEQRAEVRRANTEDDQERIVVAAEMETAVSQLTILFARYIAAVARQETRSLAAKLPEGEIQSLRSTKAVRLAIAERLRHVTMTARTIQPSFAVGTLDQIERDRASRRIVGDDPTPPPSAIAGIDPTSSWAAPHRSAGETTH